MPWESDWESHLLLGNYLLLFLPRKRGVDSWKVFAVLEAFRCVCVLTVEGNRCLTVVCAKGRQILTVDPQWTPHFVGVVWIAFLWLQSLS